MPALIAVCSYGWREDQTNSQLDAWANINADYHVRFFEGNAQGSPVIIKQACQGALEDGYDYLWKVEDTVYLRPERLKEIGDYVGVFQEGNNPRVAGHCLSFLYGLSKKAMEVIANTDLYEDSDERWVGKALFRASIPATNEPRFVLVNGRFQNSRETPTAYNSIIAAAEFTNMTNPHAAWLKSFSEWDRVGKYLSV